MYRQGQEVDVSTLVGKTLSEATKVNDEELLFITTEGERFVFYHNQDCCESVSIEDIAGDLDDLVGSPLIKAEVTTSQENPEGFTKEYQESFTWTFYHFATVKGYVTIRWYGESNGYYSEKVDLVLEGKDQSHD